MWTALDIFIGLALCYALISLFCTAIQEFIAQALDSRGKLLVQALYSLEFKELVEKLGTNYLANPGDLGSVQSGTSQKLSLKEEDTRDSKTIRSESKPLAGSVNPGDLGLGQADPSETLSPETDKNTGDSKPIPGDSQTKASGEKKIWIQSRRLMADPTPESLATIISSGMGLIKEGESALKSDDLIDGLEIPDGLKARLLALSKEAREDVDKVKAEVEKWCGDFLAEVNHWFTRRAQIVSLLIGFAVALALNVDTIELATKLKNDPFAREAAVKVAGKFVADAKLKDCPEPRSTDAKTTQSMDSKAAVKNINECLTSVQSTYPIPLGWDQGALDALEGIWAYLSKFIGLLLTAIALSLGSRFWFDTLKTLLALRTGGQPKAEAK